MNSGVRELSSSEMWDLLIKEFGIVRLVRLLGWVQIWMLFPGRDLRQVVEQESSFATSYRVLSDCRRLAEVLALAEGREFPYTLREVAAKLQAIRPQAAASSVSVSWS